MTSTALNDQFAVCTPEEEEAFRAIEARQDERRQSLIDKSDAAINALRSVVCPYTEDAIVTARDVYAAIKGGDIPGVVLGGGHE